MTNGQTINLFYGYGHFGETFQLILKTHFKKTQERLHFRIKLCTTVYCQNNKRYKLLSNC